MYKEDVATERKRERDIERACFLSTRTHVILNPAIQVLKDHCIWGGGEDVNKGYFKFKNILCVLKTVSMCVRFFDGCLPFLFVLVETYAARSESHNVQEAANDGQSLKEVVLEKVV